MSLAALKNSRNSSIDKLLNAAQSLNEPTERRGPDERMWKPTVDKSGNGYAVIRFLPAPEGEDLPFARYWDHFFQNKTTGLYYVEKSLTTIGQKDPVGELNSKLWNAGGEGSPERDQAREQKRRLHYVSNIYVVSDSQAPENEGKVFLYQYGQKIYEKLMQAMQPEFPDDDPVNPFDMWEGADFKLKIRNVAGWRNYDAAAFAAPSALADDETLDRIYSQVHSLKEFTDPSTFKSYEELKAQLDTVLGDSPSMTTQQREDLSITAESAPMKSVEAVSAAPQETLDTSSDDDDDTMSYFSKLANSD